MTYASITLTDRDGKLDMHVEYSGGMDERLPSHQHIFLMVANMEQMASPKASRFTSWASRAGNCRRSSATLTGKWLRGRKAG